MTTFVQPSLKPTIGKLIPPTYFRSFLPLVAFLAIHFVLRLITSPSLHYDDADLIIYDQSLELGYSEQPPLYSWIYRLFALCFGSNLISLTLLRTVLLGSIPIYLYLAFRNIFHSHKHAILGAYAVLLVPSLAWHALTYLTHSLLLCVVCAATFYRAVRVLRVPSWGNYFLLGFTTGLGFLSKYNFLFFVVALFTSGLVIKDIRKQFLNSKMLLAVVVATLVVTPHLWWIIQQHESLEAAYVYKSKVGKSLVFGILPAGVVELVNNVVLLAAPMIVVLLLGAPNVFRNAKLTIERFQIYERWMGSYFVALVLAHLVYILSTGASALHERWLEPFYVLLPAYAMIRLVRLPVLPEQWTRFAYFLGTCAVVLTIARCGQLYLGSAHRGYNPIDSDFANVAERLNDKMPSDSVIVSNNRGLGGNLRFHMPDIPCVSIDHFAYRPPRLKDHSKYLLVWFAPNGESIPANQRLFTHDVLGIDLPVNITHQTLELPPIVTGRQTTKIGFVVISRSRGIPVN
ncbi:MAG: glycosyltransferase family 39 protein [Gemmataceae bacterium]